MKYLRLMRVRHYIKNLLVFFPLVFSKQINPNLLLKCFCAFVSFCMTASIVYIINDLCDAPKDRKHPVKCHRPIASGEVSKPSAILLIAVLLSAVVALGVITRQTLWAWLILAGYIGINILYSCGLKNVPIIDVAILAFGFLLRIVYGASVLDITISRWLYLTVVSISFYFGLGKRRNEIRAVSDCQSRTVLQFYTNDFLDKNMYVCMALGIVFYALWTVDPVTISRVNHHSLLVWTVPLVILICLKYNLDIEKPENGDPVEVLLHDYVLLIMALIFGAFMLGIIYL